MRLSVYTVVGRSCRGWVACSADAAVAAGAEYISISGALLLASRDRVIPML